MPNYEGLHRLPDDLFNDLDNSPNSADDLFETADFSIEVLDRALGALGQRLRVPERSYLYPETAVTAPTGHLVNDFAQHFKQRVYTRYQGVMRVKLVVTSPNPHQLIDPIRVARIEDGFRSITKEQLVGVFGYRPDEEQPLCVLPMNYVSISRWWVSNTKEVDRYLFYWKDFKWFNKRQRDQYTVLSTKIGFLAEMLNTLNTLEGGRADGN